MKISVVIPTFNRASSISKPLEALTLQTMPPNEVIVVVDGSNDNTVDIVAKFEGKIPIKVVVIPNSGRSVARNTGVNNSSGDLIIFFDDDMRPFPDCIQQHVDHHSKHPNSLFVGAIREDDKIFVSDIQRWRNDLYERKGWGPVEDSSGSESLSFENLYLAAANFSISREAFEKLGGFDEQLRDIEDFDLGYRALTSGYMVFGSANKAKAFHDDLITCRSYIMRHREYGIANKYLQKLKPELYSGRPIKYFKLKISFLKRIVFFIFSFKTMVDLIDSGIFVYLIPKPIRYRFYDVVVGGLSDVFPKRKI